jgi:hypothetical protein
MDEILNLLAHYLPHYFLDKILTEIHFGEWNPKARWIGLGIILLFGYYAVEEIKGNNTNPKVPEHQRSSTKINAVLGLGFGVASILVATLPLGIAAIVCGTIAGSRGNGAGWVGLDLGILSLSLLVFVLSIAGH